MKWRIINSGLLDAVANMAIDEAILLAHGAGEAPPTLRFYGWRPAAVSLGYFQRLREEIDLEECRRRGIDVVRRLTGGRAVLHDAELTYSIVVKEDCRLVPPTITASYNYFSGGLLAGLKLLGLTARLNVPRAAYGQRHKSQTSAACFDAPGHYEITVAGRKLAGSAQVRKGGVILQHGSLLLNFSPQDAAAVLRLSAAERQKMTEILAVRAIALAEALERRVSWEEAAAAMTAAFGPALGVETAAGELTAGELAVSRKLAAGKYGRDCWNMLR